MNPNIRKPDPDTILRVADHYLHRRNYSDCRKYALQLPSHFTGVKEILAVADVLLAATRHVTTATSTTLTDWYDVIQVPRYCTDTKLITQQFNKFYKVLNPSVNKFAFADEALSSLFSAWNVLSNRVKKVEFDEKLRKALNDGDSEKVFWTVCPYCWYVYEYDRVYLGVFMRCCNEKCGRAFTCVEIDNLKGSGTKVSGCEFVEISDDDDDDDKVEKKGDGLFNVEVKMEEEEEKDVPVKKTEKRRKKSVAKKTKKVTGAGNRVTREGFMNMEEEETDVNREEEETDVFGYGAGRIVNVEYF